jgi:hypothetical protein
MLTEPRRGLLKDDFLGRGQRQDRHPEDGRGKNLGTHVER